MDARPVNYGAFQTVLRDGSLTVFVYANGNLVKEKVVNAGTTNFRGPSGFKATRWKVRVQGSGTLRELRIAGVPVELAGV